MELQGGSTFWIRPGGLGARKRYFQELRAKLAALKAKARHSTTWGLRLGWSRGPSLCASELSPSGVSFWLPVYPKLWEARLIWSGSERKKMGLRSRGRRLFARERL